MTFAIIVIFLFYCETLFVATYRCRHIAKSRKFLVSNFFFSSLILCKQFVFIEIMMMMMMMMMVVEI